MADPRQVGGTYYSGYWAQTYRVVAIDAAHCYSSTCWTVLWSDGRTTHHGTAWDKRRDRVVA